jgi:hypothetical protein
LMSNSLFTSPPELKVLNAGPDTFLVNYKFADEHGNLNGASLPEHIIEQLDAWQKEARKVHEPVPTALTFSYRVGDTCYDQTLLMRSHGEAMWPWLLFSDDVKVNFAPGTVNKGLFCRARFSSQLLHTISPEQAIVDLEAMLSDFLGGTFHEQCSELHLCVDLQGFDFSTIRLIGEQLPFVSRVTSIRERPLVPSEEEQEGGLSLQESRKLEERMKQEIAAGEQERFQDASVMTTHRRVATIDFGSHASQLSAQIYNKTLECQKHRKAYFDPIWRMNGWDGESTVWRVEFRFRRAFLRDVELDEAFSVLAAIPLLWRYATQEWLRFVDVEATHGVNISRLPTHPVWELIQHAYDQPLELEEPACTTGKQEAQLSYVAQEKPLQAIMQAQAMKQAESMSNAQLLQELVALEETLEDLSLEDLRDLAQDELNTLSPTQLDRVLGMLSPASFAQVRTSLVKRARRMAQLQACIAGGLGYLRSAAALMPLDELPGYLGPDTPASRMLPDLLSTAIWFVDKAKDYDHKKGRVHMERSGTAMGHGG